MSADQQSALSVSAVEVCFEGGGRVRFAPILEPQGYRPKIGCNGCRKTIGAGEGFFIEVDDPPAGWGVGAMGVCGSCMAKVVRPRNLTRAVQDVT